MSRALPVLALLLVAFAAADAHACSVCFSTTEENRWAFIGTTVFMSVLPVGLLVGVGVWLRRKVLEMERRAEAVRVPIPLGPDAVRVPIPLGPDAVRVPIPLGPEAARAVARPRA